MSVRSLYSLFEEQETSVAGWIRHRRLERCRRDLLDPARLAEPVSAVAARWGITNAAHFSRAFRAVYGTTPVDYRRAAMVAARPRAEPERRSTAARRSPLITPCTPPHG
jgi:AraC-like DNA-binding protein